VPHGVQQGGFIRSLTTGFIRLESANSEITGAQSSGRTGTIIDFCTIPRTAPVEKRPIFVWIISWIVIDLSMKFLYQDLVRFAVSVCIRPAI
jgi:hypothetical protein